MRLKISQVKVASLPTQPGIYRFWDKKEKLLYVGKASSLKKRLASYFRKSLDSAKTKAMVERAEEFDFIITKSDNEALLLESNIIKAENPTYNILFRDDKSYPYIHITNHSFPQIRFHRGKKDHGQYFGPFASSHAVYSTLKLIQKVFPVRQCEDSFFKNRSRPCLQYQIKRCSAPCVGLINQDDYQKEIDNVRSLLESKDNELLDNLQQQMLVKSKKMEYEEAAKIRNQIQELQHIREKQSINSQQIKNDIDVIVSEYFAGKFCLQILFIRNGWQYGSKTIWPKNKQVDEYDEANILEAFISHYYQEMPIPDEIVVATKPNNLETLENFLSNKSKRKVTVNFNSRSDRSKWLETAKENAKQSIIRFVNEDQMAYLRMIELQKIMQLEEKLNHIECFDISHTFGEYTKGSCVVFKDGKPSTKDYRIMNIENEKKSDDYSAMKQVLHRRYSRMLKENSNVPNLIIVDGGKGQGKIAKQVLEQLNCQQIPLIAIAKGEGRKAGLETLYLPFNDNYEIPLNSTSDAFHLLQYIRDEAHRFAITEHRQKRNKSAFKSEFSEISGVGNVIKQRLIRQFGGIKAVKKMGIEDLKQVKGVSPKLAEKIYNYFH